MTTWRHLVVYGVWSERACLLWDWGFERDHWPLWGVGKIRQDLRRDEVMPRCPPLATPLGVGCSGALRRSTISTPHLIPCGPLWEDQGEATGS